MKTELHKNRSAIDHLCRRYGVKRLEVFGSSVSNRFDPATSDYDFVLEFTHYGPDSARRFIAFADALEELLGRPVDLVFDRSLKPRFREFIADQREVVFEDSDHSIAA